MQSAFTTPFPTPETDDAEDVAWGLTTGAALWRQGERYDAIVWLKRAVEAANEAGALVRADQLNRAATDLIASLAVPPERPSSKPRLTPPAQLAVPAQPPPPRPLSPPPMRSAAPVPPRPPPSRRTPTPFASPMQLPEPARAPMASVTTSAPSMEALTHPPSPPDTDGANRLNPPPPPTIQLDATPATPAAFAAVVEMDMDADVDLTPAKPRSHIAALIDLSADGNAAPPTDATVPLAASEPEIDAAPEPREAAQAEEPASLPHEGPLLALIEAVDKLPLEPQQKRALCEMATIETLSAEEDVSVAHLALVVDGQAAAQATVADITAVVLERGGLLYAKSSIDETMSLRLVAEADGTIVAVWDQRVEELLAESPEFLKQLKRASDRAQAIAGCAMGPVGEQLDEGLRALAIERLEVRVLGPSEVIATAGQPVPGMVIVGVGTVELEGNNGDHERLGPGEFLFASQVLSGGAAPATARAGSKGAIVLFGARAVAHELLVTCPPLLEVFAGM